ncbi:MAG: hypothetical protein KDL09_07355 [Prosthecobacter sp.]|nr:hypothetical protein [Prosthecobacter sp.]
MSRILVILIVVSATLGTAAENQGLGRVLSGVDWRKLASAIPDDPEFQSSVRGVFGALTPDGQRKVTESINGLREGKGPSVTGTPVDTLVAKKLAQTLSPVVFDPESKNLLTVFEANGSLTELLDSIGGKASAPTTMIQPTIQPTSRTPTAKQSVNPAWFVSKTWVAESGTKWTFSEGGVGAKVFGNNNTTFTWKLQKSGLVEVLGRDTLQSPPRTWFVQFQSDSEALYGTAEKNLPNKMRPQ